MSGEGPSPPSTDRIAETKSYNLYFKKFFALFAIKNRSRWRGSEKDPFSVLGCGQDGGAALGAAAARFGPAGLVVAVFDDGLPPDDPDEHTPVIHHRDKVLVHGGLHQLVHAGVDGDGQIIPLALKAADGDVLGPLQIQPVIPFEPPQDVPLGQGAHILPSPVQDGDGGVAVVLPFFEGLPEGKVVIDIHQVLLGGEEKQNIHILKSSCLMLFAAIGSVRSAVGSAAVAAGVFTSMMSAPFLFYFSTFAHQNKVAHSFFRFYSQLLFTNWENPSQIHAQAAVLCYTKSIYWFCPGPGPCSAIQYSSPPCRNLSQKGGRRPCT